MGAQWHARQGPSGGVQGSRVARRRAGRATGSTGHAESGQKPRRWDSRELMKGPRGGRMPAGAVKPAVPPVTKPLFPQKVAPGNFHCAPTRAASDRISARRPPRGLPRDLSSPADTSQNGDCPLLFTEAIGPTVPLERPIVRLLLASGNDPSYPHQDAARSPLFLFGRFGHSFSGPAT